MRPSDGWKRVAAKQYYCTAQPGYVWAATIHLAPLMWITGWDCYLRGTSAHRPMQASVHSAHQAGPLQCPAAPRVGSQHIHLVPLMYITSWGARVTHRCLAKTTQRTQGGPEAPRDHSRVVSLSQVQALSAACPGVCRQGAHAVEAVQRHHPGQLRGAGD